MDIISGQSIQLVPQHDPPVASSKPRSFSDRPSLLEPSPTIKETMRSSQDDQALLAISPRTPKRPEIARGLSLQMPSKTTDMPMPAPASSNRAPLSPQIDPLTSYASPTTSLPRHSRGLDFSRACTNLHHSTLAESSPDSSPIITQKGMFIPSRKGSMSSMMLDSPHIGPPSHWPSLHNNNDKTIMSSSVGSVNMLASDSGSSDDSDEEVIDLDENEDSIYATPQVHRISNPNAQTPYASAQNNAWSKNFSPATASLMKNFQRTRLRKGRSRKSSSSASGHSAMHSPRGTSPPPLRSTESGNGYFSWSKIPSSRRESLALGTDQLYLSSSNDSGDEASTPASATPGVVRRAVTRRGNLLPKTKGFARIRAALMEESAPVDTDVRREAETIRQVRERDTSSELLPRQSISTDTSSPGLLPTIPGLENALEDIPEDAVTGLEDGNLGRGLFGNLNRHNSRGTSNFWDRLDKDFRTPPPSFPRGSSGMTSDVTMDSPSESTARAGSIPPGLDTSFVSDEPSSTQQSNSSIPPRKFGKRARDDDFDISSIKRRAVSPSLSVHNSPSVAQSPRDRESISWGGPPKTTRENSTAMSIEPIRSNSGGSVSSMASNVPAVGQKRVGLQGMVDTNDGLMKMSIE